MSKPGQRPGTAVGDERHVLQPLLSRKDILTLRGGPWVCAMSALVFKYFNTIIILSLNFHMLLLAIIQTMFSVNNYLSPPLAKRELFVLFLDKGVVKYVF